MAVLEFDPVEEIDRVTAPEDIAPAVERSKVTSTPINFSDSWIFSAMVAPAGYKPSMNKVRILPQIMIMLAVLTLLMVAVIGRTMDGEIELFPGATEYAGGDPVIQLLNSFR